MQSDLLDLDAILAPLAGESPTGSDLHDDFSSSYHRAQGARDAARRLERELHTAFDPEGRPRYRPADVRAKWAELRDACLGVLCEDSKDLHVAAWLVEAMTRVDGFAGLAQALQAVQGLVERYWEGLLPGPDADPDPDDGPYGNRLRHLNGLLSGTGGGSLTVHVSLIPLAEGDDGEDVNGYRIDQAVRAERGGSSGQLDGLRRAFAPLRPGDLVELLGSIGAAVERLAGLDTVLRAACGDFAPSSTAPREALEKIQRDLRYLLQSVPAAASALAAQAEAASEASAPSADGGGEAVDEAPAGSPAGASAPSTPAGGPPHNRDAALRYLRFAMEWFRAHEPHSPVSYACERAVRWADLPLPELMEELIEDTSARGQFQRLTGIRPPGTE